MSNMKYRAELHVVPHTVSDEPTERLVLPVRSFEVDGGANRKIDLNSTDEISVTSEFEQARANKNFIFYIPPTTDFAPLKLVGLGNPLQFFDMNFALDIYSGHLKIQSLWIGADGAWLSPVPSPQGGTPPLLKAKVHFHDVRLLHGKYDPRRKKIVNTEM